MLVVQFGRRLLLGYCHGISCNLARRFSRLTPGQGKRSSEDNQTWNDEQESLHKMVKEIRVVLGSTTTMPGSLLRRSVLERNIKR